jgi:hypothetical protein
MVAFGTKQTIVASSQKYLKDLSLVLQLLVVPYKCSLDSLDEGHTLSALS